MTEKSPRSANRNSAPARRAPGWIAPVLAGAVAIAVAWGAGTTIFRGALVERGLPEQVNEASADERSTWLEGAKLADLASRATVLAGLAEEGEGADALAALATSLSQGAALLGELRFDDQEPVVLPESFSSEAVQALAQDVANLSASRPEFDEPLLSRDQMLAEIAFQINFDARDAVAAISGEDDPELAMPLSTVADDAAAEPVACLPDENLLDPAAEIQDPANAEPVAVARALDRGYALDFALQLQAARGTSAAKDELEQQRAQLGSQLQTLRAVIDGQCADLRQPAYALPEDGLEELSSVTANAQVDFSEAMVTAAAMADGSAGQKIAELAFEVLDDLPDNDPDQRILESGRSTE